MTSNRASLAGFEHETINVNDIDIHYVIGGSGAPLLLWHGFCETWYCWRKIMPELARHFTVIAPDMRGFGDSSKPASGYDGLTLADDFYKLIQHLGLDKVSIVAHDMGAPAALLYAAQHPEAVHALAYLEEPVLTNESMQQIHAFTPQTTRNGALWWWKFALTSFDLSERLINGKEREFLTWFYDNGTVTRSAIEEAAVQEYLRTFRGSVSIAGAFGVYRAIFETIAQTESYKDHKITTPILGLGGARSKGDQVYEQLKQVASNVSGGTIDDCGHFPADEQSEVLSTRLLEFFRAH